jgi:hypothetical protein
MEMGVYVKGYDEGGQNSFRKRIYFLVIPPNISPK